MMYSDPRVSELLKGLSEDSLYRLKTLLQGRARRAALKVKEGGKPGDLEALRVMLEAVEKQHDKALLVVSPSGPDD